MKLFSKKNEQPGLIGIDIGAGGIKAIELVPEKGRLRLATYGYAYDSSVKKIGQGAFSEPKRVAEILKEIIKQSGIKSKNANASIPGQHVFHAVVSIKRPKEAKEIKIAVEQQIQKLLPIPLSDMIIDSTLIDEFAPKKVEEKQAKAALDDQKSDKKQLRVLVSGAPKTLVQTYLEICKLAGVELVSLETEAFALIRSLVGKDKARIMIADIGFERTNVTVVENGIPYLHRSIQAGGREVTAMIGKQMGVSEKEAEQIKLDLASSQATTIAPVLEKSMNPILHEIKYALELYGKQDFHNNTTVDKIILTGGSAKLPQIDPFLTRALNINVYVGNPWARLATPEGIQPLLAQIGPRFSVAVGLAMKLGTGDQRKF